MDARRGPQAGSSAAPRARLRPILWVSQRGLPLAKARGQAVHFHQATCLTKADSWPCVASRSLAPGQALAKARGQALANHEDRPSKRRGDSQSGAAFPVASALLLVASICLCYNGTSGTETLPTTKSEASKEG